MENEGSSNSLSMDVGKPDVTQTMPVFNTGPAVDSITPEQGIQEYNELTLDKNGKYSSWPRSAVIRRREELFKKFIAPGIQEHEKKQKEESKQWLEKENEKIAEREDWERERRSKEINIKFLKSRDGSLSNEGAEKELDRVIEQAVSTAKELSKENQDFLYTEIPNRQFVYGDLPFVISLLSGIRGDSELIEAVNGIGLEKLIRLANKSGIFGRRKK